MLAERVINPDGAGAGVLKCSVCDPELHLIRPRAVHLGCDCPFSLAEPSDPPLGKDDGLPKSCVANLDTILTVRKDRLKERIALLSAEKMQGVDKALKFALALE